MDSLQNILGNKNFEKPDEISILQDYLKRHYKTASQIRLQRGALIVSVPSSALAGLLQLERQQIIDKCKLKTKLVIRTGS